MAMALKGAVASVAVAASALAMTAPAFAGSKDFGYYPTRPAAGPCYVRGDIGYSHAATPNVSWPVNRIIREYDTDYTADGVPHPRDPGYTGNLINETYEYAGSNVRNVEMGNTFVGDIGIGCGSGSRGFRVEAVLGLRGSQKIDGEPNNFEIIERFPGDPDIDTDFEDPLHTRLRSYTLMLNAYYDLGRFGNFVPYVGAGVGVAYHRMGEVYFTENEFLTNRIEGNNDLSFAWSLMAGTAYQLTDRAILDIGYRYIDLGKAKSGRADNAGFVNPAVVVDDLAAHEFKIGLRYHFGSSGGDVVHADYAPLK